MKTITIILTIVAAVIIAMIVLGKEAIQKAVQKTIDTAKETTTTISQQLAPQLAPGTYVTAGTVENPLAFTVVGGVDNTPSTQQLFGDQSGYGGITAGGGSAGASGYRPGGTGTWTSHGYETSI